MFIWLSTFVSSMINFLPVYIPTLYLDTSKGEQSAPLIKHEDEPQPFCLSSFLTSIRHSIRASDHCPALIFQFRLLMWTDRCLDCSVWMKKLKAKNQPGAVSPMDLLLTEMWRTMCFWSRDLHAISSCSPTSELFPGTTWCCSRLCKQVNP